MKKYVLIALLLFPFFVKAEAPSGVFGFLDGKLYDGQQVLKYMCFMDGSCFDMSGQFAFDKNDSLLADSRLAPVKESLKGDPAPVGIVGGAVDVPNNIFQVPLTNVVPGTQTTYDQLSGADPTLLNLSKQYCRPVWLGVTSDVPENANFCEGATGKKGSVSNGFKTFNYFIP